MMKKIAAVLLVISLLLSLAACGKNKDGIVGSWEGKMDMTTYIELMMAELLAVEADLDPIELKMTFTFTKDGFFTCAIDEESAAQVLDAMLRSLAKNLPITGLTEDDVYALMEEQINTEDIVGKITESFVDCFYVYQDGFIYTGFDQNALESDPAANSVMTWQVSIHKNTMTVSEISPKGEQSLSQRIAGILPMTFTKK